MCEVQEGHTTHPPAGSQDHSDPGAGQPALPRQRAAGFLFGLALLPQAGVAIGLAITVSASHPDIGRIVSTVVLASVIVYEGVGPFLTKVALTRARELHPED